MKYKIMTELLLSYGSKPWIPSRKHLDYFQWAMIKFLRNVKVCSLLDKIKDAIMKEL